MREIDPHATAVQLARAPGVIEREIPGVGDLSAEELQVASRTSCSVLTAMRPRIQWRESYGTGDWRRVIDWNRRSARAAVNQPAG